MAQQNTNQVVGLARFTERPGADGIVFLILIVIYLFQMNPHPGFHDSLGFLADAQEGFHWESNATNHLLFNNLQHVLVAGFSFMSPVLVLGLVSVAFAVLTLLRLHEMMKVLGRSQTESLVAVAVLGLSFTWWQQTETIEVYTFSSFLLLSFLRYAAEDIVKGHRRQLLRASLFLGLAFLTHIQAILALPFFLLYVFTGEELKTWRRFAGLALALCGFALLFVPVAFGLNSASAVFVDRAFGDEALGLDFSRLMHGALLAGAFFAYNFHLFGLAMLAGLWFMWQSERNLLQWMLLLLLPWLAFGVKFDVPDSHVFFIFAWMVLLLPLTAALRRLSSISHSLVSLALFAALVFTPMLYFAAWKVGETHPALKTYAQEKAYKGGVAHLLWPGKRNAPDPLSLTVQLCKPGPCPDVEWHIQSAVRFLRARGEL